MVPLWFLRNYPLEERSGGVGGANDATPRRGTDFAASRTDRGPTRRMSMKESFSLVCFWPSSSSLSLGGNHHHRRRRHPSSSSPPQLRLPFSAIDLVRVRRRRRRHRLAQISKERITVSLLVRRGRARVRASSSLPRSRSSSPHGPASLLPVPPRPFPLLSECR